MYRHNPIRWGKAGAGILFFCQDEILLALRSKHVSEPLTWGIPGGNIAKESWENSFEHEIPRISEKVYWNGAVKEVKEEFGSIPEDLEVFDKVVYQEGGFVYITFLVRITPAQKSSWNIKLNWENSDAQWFDTNMLPSNLHFGLVYVLNQNHFNRLNPDEKVRQLERRWKQTGSTTDLIKYIAELKRVGKYDAKEPCDCSGLDHDHEYADDGCLGEHPGPFCGSCRAPCEPRTTDEGIGPYEFWGSKGVDSNIVTVSDCCEADLYEDFELQIGYTPEEPEPDYDDYDRYDDDYY